MIKAQDAIATARSLLGTPYSQLDCINLIKRVIRTSPGGVPGYTTAGTNTLWRSATASAKYRDLTSRQEDTYGARAGMLAFKRRGSDVHHVGIVAERPLCGMQRGGDRESQGAKGDYASSPGGNQLTVIHSSSAAGKVVETALDSSWQLLGVHRYIEVNDSLSLPAADSSLEREPFGDDDWKGDTSVETYKMRVVASSLNVRNEPGVGGTRIGRISQGAVVDVMAEMDNGWKFVRYGEGTLGYVDGSYLEAVQEQQADVVGSVTIRTILTDSKGCTWEPDGDFTVRTVVEIDGESID